MVWTSTVEEGDTTPAGRRSPPGSRLRSYRLLVSSDESIAWPPSDRLRLQREYSAPASSLVSCEKVSLYQEAMLDEDRADR